MAIIVFGGEKGGTGKTTIATNFAAAMALNGMDVLLLDTDRQGTSSQWVQARNSGGVAPKIESVQKFGQGLGDQVRDLAKRYGHIVIDAGGRDSVELRYAIGVADLAYIPIQPFEFDTWTIEYMDKLVEMAKGFNQNLQASVIINRASTNRVIKEDQATIKFFKDQGFRNLSMSKAIIRDRIAFRKAAKAGCSVLEPGDWGSDPKAGDELIGLFKEIRKRLLD